MFKMKILSASFLAIIMIAGLFYGCKKSDNSEQAPALGYCYFPLTIGDAKYYQVDSIGWLGYTYDPITQTIDIDTVSYQIKEIVQSYFADAEGRETARIERYRRNTPNDPWTLYKVFTANITPTRAERYEDNIRYVKLVFPPVENEKWTGQYLNVPINDTTFESWEYEYESVNEPASIGTFNFDSVSTVIQKSEINLIEFRFYKEQYAAGTGLISKDYSDFEYLNTTSSFIRNGFIYRETIIQP